MSTDDSTSRLPSRDLNDHPPDPHDSTSDDSATATAELANGDEVVSSPYHQHILSSINTSYHSAAGSTVQNNDSQTSLLLSHSPARASTSSPHRRPQSLSFADTPHARTPLLSSPDHRTLPNGSARPGSLYGSLSSPRSLRSRPNAHGENDEDRDSLPRLRTISSARNFGDLLKDRARKTMSIMRADVSSYDQVSFPFDFHPSVSHELFSCSLSFAMCRCPLESAKTSTSSAPLRTAVELSTRLSNRSVCSCLAFIPPLFGSRARAPAQISIPRPLSF
jgi:hypothetical protein